VRAARTATRVVLLLLTAAAASCQSGQAPQDPDGTGRAAAEPVRIPRHEHYLRNVTEIRADAVSVLLPMAYCDEVNVSGLSAGWVEEDGDRVWEGSGDARLRVLSLSVFTKGLSVRLVAEQPEPEVIISAIGAVSMANSVRGFGSYIEGVEFLLLRNDRSLER